jgi:hypothetical protein
VTAKGAKRAELYCDTLLTLFSYHNKACATHEFLATSYARFGEQQQEFVCDVFEKRSGSDGDCSVDLQVSFFFCFLSYLFFYFRILDPASLKKKRTLFFIAENTSLT